MTTCLFKMAEHWKPVPSLPGVMASSEGRLLLPPRHGALPNGGYRVYAPEPVEGVIAKAATDASHEYCSYFARHFGNIKVHRAVCEAFHGPAPFAGAVVIHLDENALNNRPENLKWGTQKENLNMPKFLAYCSSDERKATLPRGDQHYTKRRVA